VLSSFPTVEPLIRKVLEQVSYSAPDRSSFQDLLQDPIRAIKSLDKPSSTRAYLELIYTGLVLALFEDWRAAYSLASQAYTLANSYSSLSESVLEGEEISDAVISGREASALAYFCLRRQLTRPVNWLERELDTWQLRWQSANSADASHLTQSVNDLHELRRLSELSAWTLSGYMLASSKGKPALGIEKYEELAAQIEQLVKRASSTVLDAKDSNLRLALHYTKRQNLVNYLQLLVLYLNEKENVRQIAHPYVAELDSNLNPTEQDLISCLSSSKFNRYILSVAKTWSGRLDVTPALDIPESSFPYDDWRYRTLTKQITN
jgi:hypothetical protein